jgi:hypothetical protein
MSRKMLASNMLGKSRRDKKRNMSARRSRKTMTMRMRI